MWHGCLGEERLDWVMKQVRGEEEAEKADGQEKSKWDTNKKAKAKQKKADHNSIQSSLLFRWIISSFTSDDHPRFLSSFVSFSCVYCTTFLLIVLSSLLLKVLRWHQCCLFIVAILQWSTIWPDSHLNAHTHMHIWFRCALLYKGRQTESHTQGLEEQTRRMTTSIRG